MSSSTSNKQTLILVIVGFDNILVPMQNNCLCVLWHAWSGEKSTMETFFDQQNNERKKKKPRKVKKDKTLDTVIKEKITYLSLFINSAHFYTRRYFFLRHFCVFGMVVCVVRDHDSQQT